MAVVVLVDELGYLVAVLAGCTGLGGKAGLGNTDTGTPVDDTSPAHELFNVLCSTAVLYCCTLRAGGHGMCRWRTV